MSTFYLTAQMVGGGVLVKTLIGIDYEISVIVVGVLMLGYVLFGGMVATTWVQIIKAVLLVTASIVLVIMVWSQYGFFGDFLDNVVARPEGAGAGGADPGRRAKNMSPTELGQRFLEPGLLFKAPIDQISLGMALVFGTAGLPHILMRFFTVPTAQAARKSVIWAMAIIGGFYVLTLFLGMGSAMKVGADQIRAIDPGGNMAGAAARAGAGRRRRLAARQLHAGVRRGGGVRDDRRGGGRARARRGLGDGARPLGRRHPQRARDAAGAGASAARIATVVVGAMAIAIGIAAKGQNVAHLVALAFAVAASANFPCVLLTLYWKRCNTGGIVLGMIVGTLTAIGLVLVSPNMTYPKALKAAAQKVVDGAPARSSKSSTPISRRRRTTPRRPRRKRRSPASEKEVATAKGTLEQVQGRRHVARRAREAAVRAAQSGPHLDSAGLPRGDHRLAALSRQSAPRTCGTSCTRARTRASSLAKAAAH